MLGQAVGRGKIPAHPGTHIIPRYMFFHRRPFTQGQALAAGSSRVTLTHPGETPPCAHTKLAGAEALSATSFWSEATTGRRICSGEWGWGVGEEKAYRAVGQRLVPSLGSAAGKWVVALAGRRRGGQGEGGTGAGWCPAGITCSVVIPSTRRLHKTSHLLPVRGRYWCPPRRGSPAVS